RNSFRQTSILIPIIEEDPSSDGSPVGHRPSTGAQRWCDPAHDLRDSALPLPRSIGQGVGLLGVWLPPTKFNTLRTTAELITIVGLKSMSTGRSLTLHGGTPAIGV